MRRSISSEQRMVVVLFVMVIVTFFFAQADTNKIEKMYLNNTPSVTTSLDQNQNPEASSKTKEIKDIILVADVR